MLNYTNWMIFPMDQNDDVIYILILWTVGIIVMLGMALFGILAVLHSLKKYQSLLSSKSYNSHRQFLTSLVIQATFPFTVYFLPVMVAIPSEFTSKTGLIIEVEIPGMEMYPTRHDFPKGSSSLRRFYSTIFRNFWSYESLSIKFYAAKRDDIRKLLNILSSPTWKTASLWGGGRFGFYNESDFPGEKDVYAWANAYPRLAFYGFGKGINFTALVLKNLQKWVDGAEITHSFAQFHDGPWNFPFIGKKQEAFEKKYNVRIVMCENSSASKMRNIWFLRLNKPEEVVRLRYDSNRWFSIKTQPPPPEIKYEQHQLGIIDKTDNLKVTTLKLGDWKYQRTMEAEEPGGAPLISTISHRPTFDDVNSLRHLQGRLPDLSYCKEFREMCK
ncbi:unnamed protein product, partial [Mesorhabditis spiculigera]